MRTLNAVSPLATLERGYAIVTDAGSHVVTDAAVLATRRTDRGACRTRLHSRDGHRVLARHASPQRTAEEGETRK